MQDSHLNPLPARLIVVAVEVGATGRPGSSKLPTEALRFRAESYLQRPFLPPNARRTIKPPTTSMTKPQKTFDTISSPKASRINTAPAMTKSVPHTNPDRRSGSWLFEFHQLSVRLHEHRMRSETFIGRQAYFLTRIRTDKSVVVFLWYVWMH